MKTITKNDVTLYVHGKISSPARRVEIADAYSTDANVRRWFEIWNAVPDDADLGRELDAWIAPIPAKGFELGKQLIAQLRQSITVTKQGDTFVSHHEISRLLAADAGSDVVLQAIDVPTIPFHVVNEQTKNVCFYHSYDEIPFGVAYVSPVPDALGDPSKPGLLVPFRIDFFRDQPIAVAQVKLSSFPLRNVKDTNFYVTPATEANLAMFDLVKVRKLVDDCNGNVPLREAAQRLLDRLSKGSP